MAEKKRHRAKLRPKTFGAGAPCKEFPDVMRPAIVALTLNGNTVDDCREFLKKNGFNIQRASILAVMATAGHAAAPPPPKPAVELALDEPYYDDVRGVLDDFVREKRTAKRVRAWLQMAGYDPPDEQGVADYMAQREIDLAALGDDPAALDLERLRQDARSIRAKTVEVWHKLPDAEKYTQRVFLGLAAELASAAERLAEATRKHLATNAADDTSVLAEIARKLDVVLDQPTAAPATETVDTESASGVPSENLDTQSENLDAAPVPEKAPASERSKRVHSKEESAP